MMKITKGFLSFTCFALIGLGASAAQATAIVDFGGTFASNSLTTGSEATNSQNFYNLNVMFSLDTKMRFNLGWSVFGISDETATGGSTTSYSSFDMGPAFRWNIDKNGIFSLTLIYGYLAKGKYTNGSSSPEEWDGSSMLIQFGMQAPVKEDKFYVGFTLNSYTGTYTDKTVNNIKSSVSASKTSLFPMVTMTLRL